MAGGFPGEAVGTEVAGVGIGPDPGEGGEGVGGTVIAAHAVGHGLGAVEELEAGPVPSGLTGFELAGAVFVIHPGETGDGEGFGSEAEGAGGVEAGEGEVMAGGGGVGGLAGHVVGAKDDQGFGGDEVELEGGLGVDAAGELDAVGLSRGEGEGPVAIAEVEGVDGGVGVPTFAVDAGLMEETAVAGVEDGAVGEVDGGVGEGGVGGAWWGWVGTGVAEEGELKTEDTVVGVGEVSGDVPPLDLEAVVTAVVAGKGKGCAWLGDAEAVRGERGWVEVLGPGGMDAGEGEGQEVDDGAEGLKEGAFHSSRSAGRLAPQRPMAWATVVPQRSTRVASAASWATGTAYWRVQPKVCRLIT